MTIKRFEFQCKFKALDVELLIVTDEFKEFNIFMDKTLGLLNEVGAFSPYITFQPETESGSGKVVYMPGVKA